jgi:very-short-patch-repair endonuclease
MRRNPTEAQNALWEKLRDKKLAAFTFNRQVVMGSSIVDFACKSRWIAVEITEEGDDPTLEALSDRKLTDVGVRVLRFPAEQVLTDIDSVTKPIAEELLKPFERPKIETASAMERQ